MSKNKTLIIDFTGGMWVSNNTIINLLTKDTITPLELSGELSQDEEDVIKRYALNKYYNKIIIHIDTLDGPSDTTLVPLYEWCKSSADIYLIAAYNIV